MIYKLLKTKIEKGNYDKEDLLKKMDVYLLRNRITAEQYEELVQMMEGDAEDEGAGDFDNA